MGEPLELLQKGLDAQGPTPSQNRRGPGIKPGCRAGMVAPMGLQWVSGQTLPASKSHRLLDMGGACPSSQVMARTQTDPRLCEVECWGLANLSDYAEKEESLQYYSLKGEV